MKKIGLGLILWCVCCCGWANQKEAFSHAIPLHGGGSTSIETLLKTGPVYIKFWATWCGSCLEQMPHLKAVSEKYGETLHVLPVNIWVNESEKAMQDVIREFGLTMDNGVDRDGSLARHFNVKGTPFQLLIDQQGNIVHAGYQTNAELDQKIHFLTQGKFIGQPVLTLEEEGPAPIDEQVDQALKTHAYFVLFFGAQWCDWYFQELRPQMARQCSVAPGYLDSALRDVAMSGLGLMTRMWTGEKELQAYREKFALAFPVAIDTHNNQFAAFKIKQVPTAIVLKNGEEVLRITNFDTKESVLQSLRSIKSL